MNMSSRPKQSFFGVFDGHNGDGCSEWCSKNIYNYIDKLKDQTNEEIIRICLKADNDFLTNDSLRFEIYYKNIFLKKKFFWY